MEHRCERMPSDKQIYKSTHKKIWYLHDDLEDHFTEDINYCCWCGDELE